MASSPPPVIANSGIDIQSTPNAQLQDLLKKQQGFTQQLETNTTRAANVGRTNVADSMESQKQAAMLAARQAGRPWTNADEAQFDERKRRAAQQQENDLILGREKTLGESINVQGQTIGTDIAGQREQEKVGLSALDLANRRNSTEAQLKLDQARLQNDADYRKAQAELEAQRNSLEQTRQLSTLMYGPFGPAGPGPGAGGGNYPPGSTLAALSAMGGGAGGAGATFPTGYPADNPAAAGGGGGGTRSYSTGGPRPMGGIRNPGSLSSVPPMPNYYGPSRLG